jgi:hypothetical protein
MQLGCRHVFQQSIFWMHVCLVYLWLFWYVDSDVVNSVFHRMSQPVTGSGLVVALYVADRAIQKPVLFTQKNFMC